MSRTARAVPLVVGGVLVAAMLTWVPSSGAPTWLAPPVTLAQGQPGPDDVDVVVDAAGNATAAWVLEGSPMTVQASTHPVGGTWSAPTIVASGVIGGNFDLAVNAAGTAIAVWNRHDGVAFHVESASRPVGGAWSAPLPVSEGSLDAYEPRVGIDAAGNAVATWLEVGLYQFLRYATKPAVGGWSATSDVSLSSDGPVEEDYSLAVTPAGQAIAAWSIAFDDVTPGDLIQTSVRPAGGSFGPPVIVSSDTTDTNSPSVAVNGGGVATVAWQENAGIGDRPVKAATRAADGTWSDPQDVSAAGGENNDPAVAVDAAGTSTAIWARDETGQPGKLQYSTRPPGGAWAAPQELDASTAAYELPSLAIDASGRMTAAYVVNAPAAVSVAASTRAPGGTWTAPVPLSAFASGTSMHVVDVAMDDAGQAVVAWLGTAGLVDLAQVRALDSAGPLAAGLAIPGSATAGQAAAFAWPAVDAWSAVSSVTWSFGDGGTGSGSSVAHTFAAPGSYAVSVTATDAVGNATTQTGTVAVKAPTPALTGVKLTRKTIHVVGSDDKPRATKLKLTLNTAAKVVVKLKRTKKVHGKAVKAKVTKSLKAGKGAIRLTSKVGGKKLPPGTYKITVSAKNNVGTSAAKVLRLKIKP